MRRFASLALLLSLSGCGYNTWWNAPFTTGRNPNLPAGDSENVMRAEGRDVAVTPLQTEPGDLWPGPPPPVPTLQDIEHSGELLSGPEQPVPGSPAQRATVPPTNPVPGSSVPPGLGQPSAPLLPAPASPSATGVPAPMPNQTGKVVLTPGGAGVTTGGTSSYQTMTLPGGGTAIVVPNGNGTSTVIKPDGTIETIPTPH